LHLKNNAGVLNSAVEKSRGFGYFFLRNVKEKEEEKVKINLVWGGGGGKGKILTVGGGGKDRGGAGVLFQG